MTVGSLHGREDTSSNCGSNLSNPVLNNFIAFSFNAMIIYEPVSARHQYRVIELYSAMVIVRTVEIERGLKTLLSTAVAR